MMSFLEAISPTARVLLATTQPTNQSENMISTHENAGGRETSLADIEALAKTFSDAHQKLADAVVALDWEIEAIKRKHLPGLRKEVAKAAAAKLALHSAITDAPGLFVKPRTVIFHAVKLGYAKGKGKMEIPDPTATLMRLETMFPDEGQRGMYVHVEVSPNKETLAELPAKDLSRLGICIVDAEDKVVIKPACSEVEKIVAALLKDAVEVEVA